MSQEITDVWSGHTIHDGTIKTPRFNADVVEEIKAILESHGAHLEEKEEIRWLTKGNSHVEDIIRYCIITLPQGTTKTELWPRIQNSRYRVTFPDGFQIYQNEPISGDLNLIKIPLSYFCPETQYKYRQ